MSQVRITTEVGVIEATLFPEGAPRTVRNFEELVQQGYYDGLTFHRVVPDFCAQGGCPEGTGRGGPGYVIPDEHDGPNRHLTGSLSMANTGAPNSGGSQFFICHRAIPDLDGKHTVFGRVTRGIDVVYRIRVGTRIERAELVPA